MPLPASTTLLIVGAGPVGMSLALSLQHQGINDFVVVDATDQEEHSSRAMVIHAATLEELDTIGVADDLISLGMKVDSMQYYDRSSLLVSADFHALHPYTRYPFYLLLPQHMTEKVLASKLHSQRIPVYRPYKAVNMEKASGDMGPIEVTFEDGQKIRARYVIGADGGQSLVRRMSGIGFADPDGEDSSDDSNTLAQMAIADVTFDRPPTEAGRNVLFGVLTEESFFICSPLPYPEEVSTSKSAPRKAIYRIGSGVPFATLGVLPAHPSLEYVQDLIDRYGPYNMSSDPKINPDPLHVTEVVWSTRFLTRSSVADSFFTTLGDNDSSDAGVVCLVGDAAHIHPPAGGQGMNLGLRDAITLGPVLATALADKSLRSNDGIEAWANVRRVRALQVIAVAKRMASAVGMTAGGVNGGYAAWLPVRLSTLRDWGLWFAGKSSRVRRSLAYRFAGLEA